MDRLDLPQPESASSPLQCCCGSSDCVHLKKNCSILEAVEKDVHTAAQLGKVCACGVRACMSRWFFFFIPLSAFLSSYLIVRALCRKTDLGPFVSLRAKCIPARRHGGQGARRSLDPVCIVLCPFKHDLQHQPPCYATPITRNLH